MQSIRKLDVPVFTNRGFIRFDMHDYVEKIRAAIPKMHPIGVCVTYGLLAEMHRAFDDFDMKRFARLQRIINYRIDRELIWASESGDANAEKERQRYFDTLSQLVETMR